MGVPVEARRGRRRGDREAAAHGRREEDAARLRRRRARGRRRPEEEVAVDLGLSGRTADRLRRVVGHRARHRGVARRRGRERRHVRAAPRAPRARGRAARRRSPSPGDVTSADDLERLVADGRRHVRRRRHPREQLRRPAARDRRASSTPRRSRPRSQLLLVSVVRLTGLCLPHLERSPRGPHRQRDVVDACASRSTTSRSRTSSARASSAGRSRSRASSARRGSP